MQYQWYFTAILCVLALIGCGAEQTADKNANAKTKQILTYMAGLPKQGTVLVVDHDLNGDLFFFVRRQNSFWSLRRLQPKSLRNSRQGDGRDSKTIRSNSSDPLL